MIQTPIDVIQLPTAFIGTPTEDYGTHTYFLFIPKKNVQKFCFIQK
jgi:hypothetical protein